MSEKIFKTYNQQLDILEGRGIIFNSPEDKDRARMIIQREGYYKLINGYKNPFLDNSEELETFIAGTTIDEIFALYSFDRKLREIFLRYILRIETNVKNLIAYVISQKYGHDNYLIYKNFNTEKKNAINEISAVIADLNQTLARSSNDPCIQHYLQQYGYVPLWVLNNVLMLGNVSKLYSVMKIPDRQAVSKEFKLLDNTMENFLLSISIVRNFCAHENRLYCMRTKRPLVDTPLHASLKIPKAPEGEYICGKRDLFSAFIVLRYLLPDSEYRKFIRNIRKEISLLENKLKVITVNDIMQNMGMPGNWHDIVNTRK